MGTVSDGVDENSNASKDQWKSMTFENLPKETPHNIQTVLKEEQKALISANNDLIYQQIFLKRRTIISGFLSEMMRILSCSMSEANL